MMPRVSIGELADAADARVVQGPHETPVTSIHYDSRTVEPGGLFIALRGGYADGHRFLRDAFRRGAVAAMVEEPDDASEFPAVTVAENTRAALSPVAARFYGYPGNHLGVIGVTGTDGKTTTSYYIDAMLRANGFTTGLVGTVAVRIGEQVIEHDTRQTTPESLDVQRLLSEMNEASVDWAVLEATSHALALYRLNDCPFDIGVVTNVTREHLDFHGSVEAYREAKARLLRRVHSSTGRNYPRGVVINADDEGARSIAAAAGDVPIVWFGISRDDVAVSAWDVRPHERGTRFALRVGPDETEVNLKQIGSYNVLNAMAAAGVGHLIGLGSDDIRRGLESLANVPGRLHRIEMGQPFKVIVDYAHSPASLRETISLLRSVTTGRIITVFGSAGERDRGKRVIQGKLSAELADLSVFTSEDPRFEDPERIIREIAAGAEEAGAAEGDAYQCIEDRREAIMYAIRAAGPDDTVLLAGKGHETCMIYGDERRPWNEAQEAARALRAIGFDDERPETEGPE